MHPRSKSSPTYPPPQRLLHSGSARTNTAAHPIRTSLSQYGRYGSTHEFRQKGQRRAGEHDLQSRENPTRRARQFTPTRLTSRPSLTPLQVPASPPRRTATSDSPDPGPSLPTRRSTGPGQDTNGDDDEEVGPAPPLAGVKRKAEGEADGTDDDDDGSEFEANDEEEVDRTPVTHEIVLKEHTKVSCWFLPD